MDYLSSKLIETFEKNLIESFENYENMQKRHLESFCMNFKPDLEKYNFERSNAFENLKNKLSNLLKNINKENNDTLFKLAVNSKKRLGYIIETDKTLANKINTYRKELSASLKKIHKGKKALQVYGQYNNLSSGSISV